MKKMNLFLTAICVILFSSSSFSQIKFSADDGLSTPKPGTLLFNKIGKYGEELVYEASPNEAVIKWQTGKETNTSHFEIQTSFDGTNFNSVNIVAASDNTQWQTNYQVSFRKSYLSAGKVYYRLKIVFSDNSIQYTNPLFFKICSGANQTSYASLH